MAEAPDVKVGQIWADNDKRSLGRMVRVVAVEPGRPAEPHRRAVPARAEVVPCDTRGNAVPSVLRARHTRIALTRFRPTSTGYRLVQDVTDSSPNPRAVDRG